MSVDDGKRRALTPEGIGGTLVSLDVKYLLAPDRDRQRWLFPLDRREPQPPILSLHGGAVVRGMPTAKGFWWPSAAILSKSCAFIRIRLAGKTYGSFLRRARTVGWWR